MAFSYASHVPQKKPNTHTGTFRKPKPEKAFERDDNDSTSRGAYFYHCSPRD